MEQFHATIATNCGRSCGRTWLPGALALAIAAALLWHAPAARADDGQWICALIGQGVTVPQITQQLLGDPRVSRYQIEQALWNVVDRECGPTVER